MVHANVHYISQELPHLHYSANPSVHGEHVEVSGPTTDLLVHHSSGWS